MLHHFLLLLPLVLAAEQAPPPAAPAAAPSKPAIRTVQLNSGKLQFIVRIRPGAPDPGRVVDVTVEMAEVPPVPDPIYGERIPVKQAALVASVADQEGAGYKVSYVAHQLSDAGSYGFHFTPLRGDTYLLELSGRHQGNDFRASLKVPVGIWPFPPGIDDKAAGSEGPTASRLPAVPTTLQSAASPSTAAAGGPSAFKTAMGTLGEAFARLGVALLTGKQPDFEEAAQAVAALRTTASALGGELAELSREAENLSGRLAAKEGKGAVQIFREMAARQCNGCHLKSRWKLGSAGGLP